MTNYAPSFTVAKLYEKTSQQDEGSRLRQKLVHLQYRAKLQEHITLAVTRIREAVLRQTQSTFGPNGLGASRGGLCYATAQRCKHLNGPASIKMDNLRNDRERLPSGAAYGAQGEDSMTGRAQCQL